MLGAAWLEQWRQSRPTRWLVLCGALLVILIPAAMLFIVAEFRTKEIEDGKRELLTLNTSLAEQTARAFQGVDFVLARIADQVQAGGVETPEDFVRLEAGQETYELLKARVADVPQLDAITMIAADGHLVNFSRSYPIPLVDVSDRDYFKSLATEVSNRPYISEPVENRATGTWTLYVARRLSSPGGGFIGLILGAVKLNYFEDLYRSLQLGQGSAVSLWRRDGLLLARYPPLEGIGKSFSIKSFTETLVHSDVGVYQTESSIDGVRRIVATRALHDYPLVVNVTRITDDVLADWRRVAFIVFVAGALCTAAVLLVVWALARQFATYERLSRALSERAAAVLAREQAEIQLFQSQKLEAVGQLTTGIAHDFNNLLTAIIGNLDFLRCRGSDPETERYLGAIERSADRAANLTSQLLAFSRKQRLSPEAVDLNALIHNMSEMLLSTLGGTVRIELDLAEGLWPIFVDRVQIEMVVLNIAINARDAMPGGGLLTIRTENIPERSGGDPAGDHILVTIADTGAGMTQEVLARAFDPFFTTKPPGKGTGLGLSQSYGLVQQSGGSIRLDSTPGAGTTVRIALPRLRAAGAAEPPAMLPVADATSRAATVLVVDDDEEVLATVAGMVGSLGCAVLSARSGATALERLAERPEVALAIVDFAMPEMDGVALARAARSLRPGLPIVFVTGFADLESLRGEAWILQKPFHREALGRILEQALATRTRTEAARP